MKHTQSHTDNLSLTNLLLFHFFMSTFSRIVGKETEGYCIFFKAPELWWWAQKFQTAISGQTEGRQDVKTWLGLLRALPAGPAVGAPCAPVRSDCHTAGSAGESDAATCPRLASAPPSACLSATQPPPGMPAAPAAERYTAWPPAPRSSAQPATYTHIQVQKKPPT